MTKRDAGTWRSLRFWSSRLNSPTVRINFINVLEEGIKLTKVDENTIISQFLIQAESSNRSASTAATGSYHKGGPMIVIDWPAFRNTMGDWLQSNASSSIGYVVLDQGGYLSFKDKLTLHQCLTAFFLQGHRDKRLDILNRAHLQMENIERDMESLSIYGVVGMASLQYQGESLA